MPNWSSIYIQNIVPQHIFTSTMGYLARIRTPWLKNWMINRFINKYHVDMSEAVSENPNDYEDFNHFFTRQLKPSSRPIVTGQYEIASPVDGTIAQIGRINKNQLLQAKHYYFDLETLLGNDTELANTFYGGAFTTLYLAPRDYHRIHMPLTGSLLKSIYIPGRLFSVNKMTSELIPNLYSQNERLITIFNTAAGPMAVILVGAMIVGNIQTVWMKQPLKSHKIQILDETSHFNLQKGAELGHFKLGSTVILLFAKNSATWKSALLPGSAIRFGQLLGNFSIKEQ